MMKLAAMIVVANVIFWFFSSLIKKHPTNCSTTNRKHSSKQPTPRPACLAREFRGAKNAQANSRDSGPVINTTAYIVDMNGHPHKICDSIGYGFPFSTQFTNPAQNPRKTVVLAQAEPNGLFSSPTSEGTWISCVDPANKHNMQVVYVEPRVIVSPFPLSASGDLRLETASSIGFKSTGP